MAGIERWAGSAGGRAFGWLLPAGLVLAGLPWVLGVSARAAMGWDESMHAALPAARMAMAGAAGDWIDVLRVAVGCQQYPFLFPAWLAAAQGLFGVGEDVMRTAARSLWPLALFGLWLVTRELESGRSRPPRTPWLGPLLAVCIGATSPLLLAFSGTLFLEVPSFVVGLFALHAFLRRGQGNVWLREFAAGAWIAAAFFTKFNYGLLLGAGLFLALLVEGLEAARAGQGSAFLRRTAALAAAPVLTFAWWFLLPLPGGLDLAASHRDAMLGFLGGNRGGDYTPLARRLWDFGTFLSPGPAAAAVWALGLLSSLFLWTSRAARTLLLVLFVSAAAIFEHEFFLDRFLLAIALPAWPLAAAGLSRLADRMGPKGLAPAPVVVLLLAALCGRPLAGPYADAIGARNEQNAAVVDAYHRERLDLRPARALPTAGLARDEFDGIVDLVAKAAGPDGRVGWIGGSSELSPAALHLGLLARGGTRERFLRDAARARPGGEPDFDITWQQVDPGWTEEQTIAFANGFDALFSTEPIDLRRRRAREFMAKYRGWVASAPGVLTEKVGQVTIAPPFGDPYPVEVFVCRPAPR